MALQERVTTLERRIAEVVELQAKNERGMDRLEANMDHLEANMDRHEAQAVADREQAKADLSEFREALRRDTDAFKTEVRAWIRESRQLTSTMAGQWGDLTKRLGTVTEDVAAPNVPRVAR